MEEQQQSPDQGPTVTTTTQAPEEGVTATTTTIAPETEPTTTRYPPLPGEGVIPKGSGRESVDPGDRTIDATSVLHGKKINPRTGTQTSDDDPNGVYAANAYNPIQIEQAGHTLTQTTPGGAEKQAEVLSSLSNDGTKTAFEPKPTTPAGVQNDAADAKPTPEEELTGDKQIQQGETGAEKRLDLEDQHGGGSGSNVGSDR